MTWTSKEGQKFERGVSAREPGWAKWPAPWIRMSMWEWAVRTFRKTDWMLDSSVTLRAWQVILELWFWDSIRDFVSSIRFVRRPVRIMAAALA
ncbi:hypothetical protein ES702_02337 [subsurface metagenome]